MTKPPSHHRRGRITVGALMAELEKDPEYQARMLARSERQAEARAANEPEWRLLRDALLAAGIDPTDLGSFVGDTMYFEPSRFDERAAMPVLLDCLPMVTRPVVVIAVVGHLRRPWARPAAFPPLLNAFNVWVGRDNAAAVYVAASLASAADLQSLPVLLQLAETIEYGSARGPVVESLWRYSKKDDRVIPALRALCADAEVCGWAMSGLRRSIGGESALPYLKRLRDEHPDDSVRAVAAQQTRRAERSVAGRSKS